MKTMYFKILCALCVIGCFTNCSDDDSVSSEAEREFMTMFRTYDTTGKDPDPYKCAVENTNDVHLYWYGVDGCAGYEIKVALMGNVQKGGSEYWDNPDNIEIDTIVGPDVVEMVIKDLQYSTDYRFAIRTLSTKGEAYHSKWFGYGGTRDWANYMGLTTEDRYDVPEVIVVSDITESTCRVHIDRSYANSHDTEDLAYSEHFEIDEDENYVMQILTVEPNLTNPNATVPSKWVSYVLTEEDFERGYVDIDGLDSNCLYNINVQNTNISVKWDAIYNTATIRMDGEPGDPILIEWYCDPNDTIAGATSYNACRIDTILSNYNSDSELAEGTIFELEGGKVYYLAQNVDLCKGFTLRTRESDVEKGLRATVYMNGMSTTGTSVNSMNFMFGRMPQSGEVSGINVKDLIFENIDFDCPLAKTYDGSSNGTGNYFINMWPQGIAVSIQSLQIRGCTFQRMRRGFIRTQGSKRKNIDEILVENNQFYNCGYYQLNGGGYGWVSFDKTNIKSNIYTKFIWRNNTMYDSPIGAFIGNSSGNFDWPEDYKYDITIENNTIVNYDTRASGRNKLIEMRYIPGGSTIRVRNNLFILTKNDNDSRDLFFEGADVRQINGTGEAEFIIENNWSTNANLTNGQIFSAAAFSATKNSFGKWTDFCTSGADELDVHVCDITPTELMSNPNPPHTADDLLQMHSVDNLNGLYYNKTSKVTSSEIYTLGIGADTWR